MCRERTFFTAVALGASMCLGPTTASADNHFILELGGGAAHPVGQDSDISAGFAGVMTLGVGGRIRGLAPTWYLVGRVGYADGEQTGPPEAGSATIDRSAWEAAGGGRMYFPLAERLRLVTEIDVGEVFESAKVARARHPSVSFETNPLAVFLLAGLQYRVSDGLALGGGVDLAWYMSRTDAGRDVAATAAGIDPADESRGRVRYVLTTTLHF